MTPRSRDRGNRGPRRTDIASDRRVRCRPLKSSGQFSRTSARAAWRPFVPSTTRRASLPRSWTACYRDGDCRCFHRTCLRTSCRSAKTMVATYFQSCHYRRTRRTFSRWRRRAEREARSGCSTRWSTARGSRRSLATRISSAFGTTGSSTRGPSSFSAALVRRSSRNIYLQLQSVLEVIRRS